MRCLLAANTPQHQINLVPRLPFRREFLAFMKDIEIIPEEDALALQLGPSTTGNQIGIACFKAALQKPIQPGKSGKLRSAASFTNLQKPFPAAIFQNEPQRVLFTDNAYILSPYKIHKQTTSVSCS